MCDSRGELKQNLIYKYVFGISKSPSDKVGEGSNNHVSFFGSWQQWRLQVLSSSEEMTEVDAQCVIINDIPPKIVYRDAFVVPLRKWGVGHRAQYGDGRDAIDVLLHSPEGRVGTSVNGGTVCALVIVDGHFDYWKWSQASRRGETVLCSLAFPAGSCVVSGSPKTSVQDAQEAHIENAETGLYVNRLFVQQIGSIIKEDAGCCWLRSAQR